MGPDAGDLVVVGAILEWRGLEGARDALGRGLVAVNDDLGVSNGQLNGNVGCRVKTWGIADTAWAVATGDSPLWLAAVAVGTGTELCIGIGGDEDEGCDSEHNLLHAKLL